MNDTAQRNDERAAAAEPRAHDPVLRGFLERQASEARTLAGASDLVEVWPIEGVPPTRYAVLLHCRGLVRGTDGDVREAAPWLFSVCFPVDYLRRPTHPAELLAYLGPHAETWHPNLRPGTPFVCVEIRVGTPLTEIAHTLFDLVTWGLFGTADNGLNAAAAQWARSQPLERFPVDRRPLKRRTTTPAAAANGASLITQ